MFEVSQIATPGNQSGAIEGMGMEVIESSWAHKFGGISAPKKRKNTGSRSSFLITTLYQVMGYLCAGSNRTRVPWSFQGEPSKFHVPEAFALEVSTFSNEDSTN